jgi:hypothetical protein
LYTPKSQRIALTRQEQDEKRAAAKSKKAFDRMQQMVERKKKPQLDFLRDAPRKTRSSSSSSA